MTQSSPPPSRSEERKAFVILAVFLAPVLAIAGVGSLGLIIWLSQMYFGPPTG
jgi:nitrate reductase NapE